MIASMSDAAVRVESPPLPPAAEPLPPPPLAPAAERGLLLAALTFECSCCWEEGGALAILGDSR